jgi:hypothetical protein
MHILLAGSGDKAIENRGRGRGGEGGERGLNFRTQFCGRLMKGTGKGWVSLLDTADAVVWRSRRVDVGLSSGALLPPFHVMTEQSLEVKAEALLPNSK